MITVGIFMDELQKLLDKTPKPPLSIHESENVSGNYIHSSKNLFNCFDSAKCSDSTYLFDSGSVASSADCDYAVESELCYESVDPFKAFNCTYLENCANIRDSDFCAWCTNSDNLFGCVKLQGKSFCIFNRQLSEQEYKEKVAEYKKWPVERIFAEMEKIRLQFPFTQTNGANNDNADFGNYMHYCKNCYMSFDAAFDENCAYVYDTFHCRNTYDASYEYQDDLVYEGVDSITIFNSDFIVYSKNCSDSAYIFNSANLQNCLGCVFLTNKQYCILNRQFGKDEYQKISSEILNQLKVKQTGWGEIRY